MCTLDLRGIDKKKLFVHFIGTSTGLTGSIKNGIKAFLVLARNVLLRNCEIKVVNYSEQAKIVFIQPMKVARQDFLQILKDVSSLLDESEYDYFGWTWKKSFSLRRALYMIRLCYLKRREVLLESVHITLRLRMLAHLITISEMEKQLSQVTSFGKYNLCVLTYDANLYNNYFSQRFKLAGVKTATLQHGVMLAAREGLENSYDFMGLEFRGFVSDYFLAWNDFTLNEAVKQGISKERIQVIGNVKCLNTRPVMRTQESVFGVVLDGECEDENNQPMIRLANEIAEKYNLKYMVRYHPNYAGNEFRNDILNKYGRACSQGVSLPDFLSEVSFCILSNSTVLFELPYYHIQYFRYSSRDNKDKYSSLKEDSFHTLNEFREIFERRKESVTDYPSSNEIRNRYRSFLLAFCSGRITDNDSK